MKNLLLIISLLFVGSITTIAQTNKVISTDKYIVEYNGVATSDTVGGTVTTWNKPILLDSYNKVFYNFKVKVSETASFACTVKLQGKVFSDDSYTDITTKTYTGIGTDTTVTFIQDTSASKYRYFNVLITRTAGTGKLTYIKSSFKR